MSEDHLAKLKKKYIGEAAKSYEASRRDSKHWRQEQKIVELLLDKSGLDDGSSILDIPVGTGRFFSFYKDRGYHVLGLDVSPDMLSEAESKAEKIGYSDVVLRAGDITDIPLRDKSVDLSVCIRLMNWFDFHTFQQALSELARVSSQYIIVGVRMSSGWTQDGNEPWLKQILKAWRQALRGVVGRVRGVLRQQLSDTHSSEPGSSDPPLVDHSEEAVRRAFREQELTVVQEKHAMLFTSDPSLSRLGAVQKLPYRIFLLRV